MPKRFLSLVTSGLLLHAVGFVAPVFAETSSGKEARLAAKVRASVAKIGTGPEARVKVILRDKSKMEGYVNEIGEESFVVIDGRTGAATAVAYSQVGQVKGNNLSTGQKVLVGLGIAAGVILFLALLIDE